MGHGRFDSAVTSSVWLGRRRDFAYLSFLWSVPAVSGDIIRMVTARSVT